MKRFAALSLCNDRGFQPGDKLVSSAWKTPRTLVSLQTSTIIVRIGSQPALMPLSTLPADTQKLED